MICDNQSVTLSFNKGRCKNIAMLRLIRRVCAYTLAFKLYPRWRYLETDRNPADAATRPWLQDGANA